MNRIDRVKLKPAYEQANSSNTKYAFVSTKGDGDLARTATLSILL